MRPRVHGHLNTTELQPRKRRTSGQESNVLKDFPIRPAWSSRASTHIQLYTSGSRDRRNDSSRHTPKKKRTGSLVFLHEISEPYDKLRDATRAKKAWTVEEGEFLRTSHSEASEVSDF